MADKILLAKTDAAANSAEFVVKAGSPKTVYLFPVASLTASEYANLERKDPDGTWGPVYDNSFAGGGQVRLDSATATGVTVVGEGTYRVDLDDPTNSIGVALADTTFV
jgi:hypothetical protein